MLRLRHLVPLACALALPFAAHAQDTSATTGPRAPDVGARVLVTFARADGYQAGRASSPTFVGRLVQATTDSLWVQPHPSVGPVAVPRGAVHRLYVSRGQPRGPSIAWGAATGAVFGAELGIVAAYPPPAFGGNGDRDARDEAKVIALYAVSGAISGMLTGALYPRERWRRVR